MLRVGVPCDSPFLGFVTDQNSEKARASGALTLVATCNQVTTGAGQACESNEERTSTRLIHSTKHQTTFQRLRPAVNEILQFRCLKMIYFRPVV